MDVYHNNMRVPKRFGRELNVIQKNLIAHTSLFVISLASGRARNLAARPVEIAGSANFTIQMQAFSRSWLRSWAGMALFAMLSILASPALAFACCCNQELPSTPVAQTIVVPPAEPIASHPGCHGHDTEQNTSESKVLVSVTPNASPSEVAIASSGQQFQSVCDCAHAGDIVLALVEVQNTSSFSTGVMSGPPQARALVAAPRDLVRFAFASRVGRPRGPDLASGSGRAPPVFSL
jgi:hypothetical protein